MFFKWGAAVLDLTGFDSLKVGSFILKISPARDPKQCEGAKGYETSGGNDISEHTCGSTHMKANICEHTYESTHMRAHR